MQRLSSFHLGEEKVIAGLLNCLLIKRRLKIDPSDGLDSSSLHNICLYQRRGFSHGRELFFLMYFFYFCGSNRHPESQGQKRLHDSFKRTTWASLEKRGEDDQQMWREGLEAFSHRTHIVPCFATVNLIPLAVTQSCTREKFRPEIRLNAWNVYIGD